MAHTPTGTRKTRPLTKARSASGRENHPEKKLQAGRNFFGQFFHEHPKGKKKGKKKMEEKMETTSYLSFTLLQASK
jgi:hypothetical protein